MHLSYREGSPFQFILFKRNKQNQMRLKGSLSQFVSVLWKFQIPLLRHDGGRFSDKKQCFPGGNEAYGPNVAFYSIFHGWYSLKVWNGIDKFSKCYRLFLTNFSRCCSRCWSRIDHCKYPGPNFLDYNNPVHQFIDQSFRWHKFCSRQGPNLKIVLMQLLMRAALIYLVLQGSDTN